ncbi:hypothetical protein BJ944DRAFT_247322 [Cunninghamella echinulata]|nr:hypothetical protein BJ944DRAFT_247322 [Cunninghamella echinulata]
MATQRRNISTKSPTDVNPTISQVYQQKNSLHTIYSTLPTVAIASTVSFFIHYFHSTAEPITKNVLYYGTTLSFLILCSIYIYLQVNHVSYEDWKKDQTTTRCIQIATITSLICIVGYHIIYFPVYGWLTSIWISSLCALIFSVLTIITSFI